MRQRSAGRQASGGCAEQGYGRLGHFGRRAPDARALPLERLGLGDCRPLGAGDDGALVAHRLAGRGGETGM